MYLSSGKWSGPMRLVAMASSSFFAFRKEARKITSRTLLISAGSNTIGPIPMWGLPTYIIFFGAISYVFLREVQTRGFNLRAFWTGIAITFAIDLLIELPLLYAQGGLYQYYGHTPMTVFRFPVYWLLINTTGPILCAAVLRTVYEHGLTAAGFAPPAAPGTAGP